MRIKSWLTGYFAIMARTPFLTTSAPSHLFFTEVLLCLRMIIPKPGQPCASLQPWKYPASWSFQEELFSLTTAPHLGQPHFTLAWPPKSSGSYICLIRWGRMWSLTLLILSCANQSLSFPICEGGIERLSHFTWNKVNTCRALFSAQNKDRSFGAGILAGRWQ